VSPSPRASVSAQLVSGQKRLLQVPEVTQYRPAIRGCHHVEVPKVCGSRLHVHRRPVLRRHDEPEAQGGGSIARHLALAHAHLAQSIVDGLEEPGRRPVVRRCGQSKVREVDRCSPRPEDGLRGATTDDGEVSIHDRNGGE